MKIKSFAFCVFFTGIVSLFVSCSNFAAGSYPYAEHYELNYSETEVLNAIHSLKSKNPELQVSEQLLDENETDLWHHEWFSLGNQLAMTWTRPSGKNETTFALVSVGRIGNWKDVNIDFDSSENSRIKKEFEEFILEKLKFELKNAGSR